MPYDLSWLWPLLAGALLTAAGAAWRDYGAARQKRIENGREHAIKALSLATRIGSEVSALQAEQRFAFDPVTYDTTLLLELSEVSELLPAERARTAVEDACFIVNAARAADQFGCWEERAGNVQRGAMFTLRRVLGAGARGEPRLPSEDIEWLGKRARLLREAIDRLPG